MIIEKIKLTTDEFLCNRSKNSGFKIKIPNSLNTIPFDIDIEVFGELFSFKSFADYYLSRIDKKKAEHKPLFTIVIENNSYPFVSIIGIDEVIFIDFVQKSLKKILKMYRKQTDDEGFYWLSVKARDNGFLLIYESGVARIENNGNIRWHNPLRWDDIYIKSDESYLFYSSEYRNELEEWRLDIEQGIQYEGW